jgi:hypothetical protein
VAFILVVMMMRFMRSRFGSRVYTLCHDAAVCSTVRAVRRPSERLNGGRRLHQHALGVSDDLVGKEGEAATNGGMATRRWGT